MILIALFSSPPGTPVCTSTPYSFTFYLSEPQPFTLQNVLDPGMDPESFLHSSQSDATQPFPSDKPCPNIPLNFILSNSISLKFFIDFMNHIKAERYLYMWLSIDCFRDELQNRVDSAARENTIISDAEENMFRKVRSGGWRGCSGVCGVQKPASFSLLSRSLPQICD